MWGERRFLDIELEEWHLECWAWLLRNLGGLQAVRKAPLVLPTGAFFPRVPGDGHEVAQSVFDRTKVLMGMESWPCTLVERQRVNVQVGEFLVVQQEGRGIAGTFESDDDGEIFITYDPDLLKRPYNLITTFAHELAHYALHQIDEPVPGAENEPLVEELATEMAVAFFGLGVIAANAAFDFQQYQDAGRHGWQGGAWGYFSEDGWAFALAVFLALREQRSDDALRYLKPNVAKKLSKATARLAAKPALVASLL